jgi:uncharacterized iron-regulated membrane protein
MYRSLRTLHKWIGLFACLFLTVIAFTGFLLSIKKRVEWLQPATRDGGEIAGPHEVIPMHEMFEAAKTAGGKGFEDFSKLDRVDYRSKQNVYKVRSADGLKEVQVDGKTGAVLNVSPRRDQLTENIHDMNFVAPWMHAWVLPAVALGLFFLGISGCIMFFVPVFRRWKFKRGGGVTKGPA